MYHLEFMGIPGSGKSTAVDHFSARLKQSNIDGLVIDQAVCWALNTDKTGVAPAVCTAKPDL
jgi:hypothetical protein